jgi:molybdate transport system ATP-binding protein
MMNGPLMDTGALDVRVRRRLGAFQLDATFRAEAGLTALFGRSGSGKTSVVSAIAGLLPLDEGRIVSAGTTLYDSAAGVDLPAERRRIGYVFQDARLFPHLTVRDNLLYGWKRVPPGDRRIPLDQVVDLLGIGALLDRRPAKLSGGEKQRVAIGRALLAQPRLLLMDEPLASLDTERKHEILPYIERLRDESGIPIVYVSHAMEEVARLATTIVLMDAGRVVATGAPSAISQRLDLWPLMGRFEAGAVVDARVLVHDEAFMITELGFSGGRLRIPRVDAPVGTPLRIRIRARDVSIATAPPGQISIQNVLAGTLAEIRETAGAYAELSVSVGAERLLARITRESMYRLGLKPGDAVWVLVKSVAFDGPSVLPAPPASLLKEE